MVSDDQMRTISPEFINAAKSLGFDIPDSKSSRKKRFSSTRSRRSNKAQDIVLDGKLTKAGREKYTFVNGKLQEKSKEG